MGRFILFLLLLWLGFFFGIFYFGVSAALLFYGFPKALIGFITGKLKFRASLYYLSIFIGWQLGIFVVFFIILVISPKALNIIKENEALHIGSFLGFWFSVFKAIFSKSTRNDMADDYQEFTQPYLKP